MAKELISGKLYDILVEMYLAQGYDKKNLNSIWKGEMVRSTGHNGPISTGAMEYSIVMKNPAPRPEKEKKWWQFGESYKEALYIYFSSGELLEYIILNKL